MSKESDFVDLLNKEMYELKIAYLEAKLEESEKKHLIDEKEWQDYCAFKHIEPQIKGCLDREREYEKQLAEKDEEIAYLTKQVKKLNNEAQKYFEDAYCNDFHNQDKISFAIDILEELAGYSNYINSKLDFECSSYVSEKAIRDKIKYLKGKKDE